MGREFVLEDLEVGLWLAETREVVGRVPGRLME
jgi:hypothetical protein